MPPAGRNSGRLMDPNVFTKISSIWPSSEFFEHDVASLMEQDEVHTVPVKDARCLSERPTIETHGFELATWPSAVKDFDDASQVDAVYIDETRELVKVLTGAKQVFPFHHLQIHTGNDRFGKRGGAVERVHGDYTEASGPRMLEDLVSRGIVPPDVRKSSHGAIINVWRNASHVEVQTKPLAVCDVRSVAPDDLGVYYLVEGGETAALKRRMGQNLSVYYSPRHEWFYYSRMHRDEALVFFTYDGRTPAMPRFTLHAAVCQSFSEPNPRGHTLPLPAPRPASPSSPIRPCRHPLVAQFDPADVKADAPPRQAVIVRCAAFF